MKIKGLMANMIAGCMGLAMSIYIWVATASFPVDTMNVVGADYFPRLLSAGLALASAAMMIITFVTKKDEEFDSMSIKRPGIKRAIMCFVATVLFAVLIKQISFIIAATLYLFGIMILLKKRNWVVMAILSVVIPIIVYNIFQRLMGVQLPLGFLKSILY